MRRVFGDVVLKEREETFLNHFGKWCVETKVVEVLVRQKLLIAGLLLFLKLVEAVQHRRYVDAHRDMPIDSGVFRTFNY
jgi:hypothetical protein